VSGFGGIDTAFAVVVNAPAVLADFVGHLMQPRIRMKMSKNDRTLLILGSIFVVGLILAHGRNRQEREMGRQLEDDVIDDTVDFFL